MDFSTIADCPQDQWGMVLGGLGDFTLPQLKNKVFAQNARILFLYFFEKQKFLLITKKQQALKKEKPSLKYEF
jgi:hypothetical protein